MDIWGKSFAGQRSAWPKNMSWEHAQGVIKEDEERVGGLGQNQMERSTRKTVSSFRDMPFSHRLCCSDESTMNIPSSWQDKGLVGWSLYPGCVWEGGSQILINGFETLSSPPLLSKLQLSFHLQQRWECRPGS